MSINRVPVTYTELKLHFYNTVLLFTLTTILHILKLFIKLIKTGCNMCFFKGQILTGTGARLASVLTGPVCHYKKFLKNTE